MGDAVLWWDACSTLRELFALLSREEHSLPGEHAADRPPRCSACSWQPWLVTRPLTHLPCLQPIPAIPARGPGQLALSGRYAACHLALAQPEAAACKIMALHEPCASA